MLTKVYTLNWLFLMCALVGAAYIAMITPCSLYNPGKIFMLTFMYTFLVSREECNKQDSSRDNCLEYKYFLLLLSSSLFYRGTNNYLLILPFFIYAYFAK